MNLGCAKCQDKTIFRCCASEGGGTSRFASKLIGEREVIRQTKSTARGSPSIFSKQMPHTTTTTSEQHATECAVMASERGLEVQLVALPQRNDPVRAQI